MGNTPSQEPRNAPVSTATAALRELDALQGPDTFYRIASDNLDNLEAFDPETWHPEQFAELVAYVQVVDTRIAAGDAVPDTVGLRNARHFMTVFANKIKEATWRTDPGIAQRLAALNKDIYVFTSREMSAFAEPETFDAGARADFARIQTGLVDFVDRSDSEIVDNMRHVYHTSRLVAAFGAHVQTFIDPAYNPDIIRRSSDTILKQIERLKWSVADTKDSVERRLRNAERTVVPLHGEQIQTWIDEITRILARWRLGPVIKAVDVEAQGALLEFAVHKAEFAVRRRRTNLENQNIFAENPEFARNSMAKVEAERDKAQRALDAFNADHPRAVPAEIAS